MFPAQEEADRTVFVGNLESRVREEILYELFLQLFVTLILEPRYLPSEPGQFAFGPRNQGAARACEVLTELYLVICSRFVFMTSFLQAGPLIKVTICKDKEGKPKSFGFVCFKHTESVSYAIALLNGIRLYGRPINVQYRFGSSHSSELNSQSVENYLDVNSQSYRNEEPWDRPAFPMKPFTANDCTLPQEYSFFQKMKYSPEKQASFFSKVTYSWFSRIIILGYTKPLEREDLFELNESDSPYTIGPIFEKQWRKEVFKSNEKQKVSLGKGTAIRKPSLLSALWTTFRVLLTQVALFKVFADILSFTSPLIMKQMIILVENRSDLGWIGCSYAVALFAVAILQTLVLQLYQRFNILTSAKIKTAVIGLIYKKALNLSNFSRKKFTTGEVVNLMSADAQQLMDLAVNLNLLWSAPLQILMAILLLWQELGPSVLAGVAVLILVIPINALVATRIKKLKKSQLKSTDQRIKLVSEILHGIKILKLYAWEPSYQKKITEIRERELNVLKSAGYLTVFSMLTLTCIPFLVSLATFGVYFLQNDGNILTATKVFTSISLFNILRLPLFDLPVVISAVVQTKISLGRLEDFFNAEELGPENIETNHTGDHSVGFIDASFRWDKTGTPVLNDLNIKIPEGALVAVVGQVGSGKSSVLSAILGEMEKLTGTVQRKGSVAYVSQQAWIQNSTLQDNILFGSVMEQQYYEKVLEACALLPDLEQLPHGDQTEIGERGVNISGGQKQRVSLARAVYSGADIYLLDDPLSAVDVHVGKHLFEKIIGSSGLLKGKTRILVTHNLTLLPQMDLILVMERGRVTQTGTYLELLSKPQNFTKLLQVFSADRKEDVSMKIHASEGIRQINSQTTLKDQFLVQKGSSTSDQGKQFTTKKEPVPTGGVKFSIIIKYLQAFGWLWVWLSVATYLCQNAVGIGQNLWLSTWTKETKEIEDFTEWKQLRNKNLGVYGILGITQGLLVCSSAFMLTRGAFAASRTLHQQMLGNVLRLPLCFFETNPVGQVINRFTKDIFIVDVRFHYYLRTWLNCTLDVAGTILVIVGALPFFILVVIPLIFLYFTIQRYYIASSRQIRRLAGASRSPVISHFSETLAGVSTIRAFGHQQRFISHSRDVVNENLVCLYNNVISNRWLSVRLEFLGNMMVLSAAMLAMMAGDKMDSATVGLTISYALNITQSLNFWVRKACEIETNAVCIERVCEYAKMDKEAPWIMPRRPPPQWPTKGVVEFVGFQARYRSDLSLALQDVSFQTHSGEKVGIVGRTGAGKSTLTNCLFRIVERAGGKIVIDGIDISTIGLHDLRGQLNIIPQDPVLFSGTIQMNLDPLEKYSDSDLWEALELCHLKDFVQALPKKLSHEIVEGGENLSVGQRQLICLARALLRKTKILILDEATASIDFEMDNLVQSTIRKEFVDCTVLTIAHRLHTIMDSQRVLVLESGKIVEFDTPHALMQRRGVFSKMVTESEITGDSETNTNGF
ncbi:multidrug resistance-associated protein 1 isoform X2 [Ornithorhynchus anatinus]|uniref:multidrug resistance-associated protein 1 isoform X2 n=1 Tax=Ornithorhynchus anatinus TaxID=9258 RepID=UPI0010A88B9C|nr:multidrug resistance-associated protein 1 isoform X2 [Ornithorhynchus anatinus]